MERLSFHEQIKRNKLKSVALLAGIFVVFLLVGYLIGLVYPGYFFVIMAFAAIFSIIYTFVGYYNSGKISVMSVGAAPADPVAHRQYLNIVESMAIAAGLPAPKAYVMRSEQINAFASGRDPKNAVICVTTGALQKLNKVELEGVIAHEMAHIANYDIRFITIASVVVGLIAVVAEIFLRSLWFSGNRDNENRNGALIMVIAVAVAILAPIITNLISLAISRKREFAADATAVKLTRYSPGLRSALLKIKEEHVSPNDRKRYVKSMAPMFISDPFKKKFRSLFSTHPDIDDRIKVLARM